MDTNFELICDGFYDKNDPSPIYLSQIPLPNKKEYFCEGFCDEKLSFSEVPITRL